MSLFLDEAELEIMCSPLKQAAAQRRYLDRLGVPYTIRPDGRPLVLRDAAAERLALGGSGIKTGGGATVAKGPNREALLARLAARKKGVKSGTTA